MGEAGVGLPHVSVPSIRPQVTSSLSPKSTRVPLWRDVRVLRVVGQVLAVVAVFLMLRWLWGNLTGNLDRLNMGLDFGFLTRPTQFQIPYRSSFDPRSPVIDMVLVGVLNTFLAGFAGIALALALGLVVGVSRLSANWLVSKLAMVYVEFFRNIPPLVIIIFFAAALFTYGPFPNLREATLVGLPGADSNLLILSNDQWGIPGFTGGQNWVAYLVILGVGLILAVVAWAWRTSVNDRTGMPHHRVAWFLGVLTGIAVIGYLVVGSPITMSWPAQSENRRLIVGGFAMNWGFMSLTAALGLYTASHVGEIIRGSIQAVPRGQTEASSALALSGFQRYRFVVLPQALRIAIPPIINQCLNLVKNTSLGTAVAYAEITALTQTSIGNGRPALQSILVMMVVYLAFSLTISFLLNVVNRRLQLATR
jgi:general L-amino acid transport system permease protein